MAFCPPVSAISGMSQASSAARRASVRLINCATSVEPVKITPRTRASAVSAQAPTVSPRPGRNCNAAARGIAAFPRCSELHGACAKGDQRRLFGRLCQHYVAGRQCGAHFADKDRQREIPGADAHHRAQRRSGHSAGAADLPAPRSSALQEIDRLAYFGNRVRQRLAGFANRQRHQFVASGSVQTSSAARSKRGGAFATAGSIAASRLHRRCRQPPARFRDRQRPCWHRSALPTTSRWSAGLRTWLTAPSGRDTRGFVSHAEQGRGMPLLLADMLSKRRCQAGAQHVLHCSGRRRPNFLRPSACAYKSRMARESVGCGFDRQGLLRSLRQDRQSSSVGMATLSSTI